MDALRRAAASAAVLIACAGSARAESPKDFREPSISGEELVSELASFAGDAARQKKDYSTAQILYAFSQMQYKKYGSTAILDPSKTASWLCSAAGEEIEQAFAKQRRRMREICYALFVALYGIEFHYVLDAAGREGNVLDSDDLDAVMAYLLRYPPPVLIYLGGIEPGLSIRLHTPGLVPPGDPGCVNHGGCYDPDDNSVRLGYGNRAVVVHEVGHQIRAQMILRNQDDPWNPLAGARAEYDEIFPVPAEWAWVDYGNYGTVAEMPPGFLNGYALISDDENFAVTCGHYALGADAFFRRATDEARDGETLLCRKLLFMRRLVYGGLWYAGSEWPGSALVLSGDAVDLGDGDGCVESGEGFSMRLELLALEGMAGAVELRCVPKGADLRVLGSSVALQGLEECRTYRWDAVGLYQAPAAPGMDAERKFDLACAMRDGSIRDLGVLSVTMNPSGHLWTFLYSANAEGAALLRLDPRLAEAGLSALPPEPEPYYFEDRYWKFYDARSGCFWFLHTYPYSDSARFRPDGVGGAAYIPLDPGDLLQSDEIHDMHLNPVDGAVWAEGDSGLTVRVRVLPDGGIERCLIPESEHWDYGFSVDARSGRAWAGEGGSLFRYAPSGDLEATFADLPPIGGVAAAADGGCWILSGQTLAKVSPVGAVGISANLGVADYYLLYSHPYDGSLWIRGWNREGPVAWLLRVGENGVVERSWETGRYVSDVVPSTVDGSVYCFDMSGDMRAARYFPDGSSLPEREFPGRRGEAIGFQPREGGPPKAAIIRGAAYAPPGSAHDLGDVGVGACGAAVEFRLRNNGVRDLLKESIRLAGADAGQFRLADDGRGVAAAGEGVSFTVRFCPAGAGEKTASVQIATNDCSLPVYTIGLRGRGVLLPDINVRQGNRQIPSGGSFDVGAVSYPVALGPVASFTVENTGRGVLNITGCKIIGTDSAHFRVVSLSSAAVVPGGSAALAVQFRPSSIGVKTASVDIRSNDPDENPYRFTVTGRAGLALGK